ncbi:uncharacterized protein LOC121917780 isoform X2 [Sceloporus undulatus]|nr:uncharacterized protein LOC121917780 isoform X2 [Sceloporus undulatus]
MTKPVRRMFRSIWPQNKKNKNPDLPEVKISYPQSLEEARSCMSLTETESACPAAEVDLGASSDSLEGIPEMQEAESVPSLMENDEEEEDTGKGKDGEKVNNSFDSQDPDGGPCTFPDGGPRVQEVQESTSDEKCSDQEFDLSEFNSSPTKEALHRLCKKYSNLSQEEKWDMADAIARNHVNLMVDHYLESKETACDELMCAVLSEGQCNHHICLTHFFMKMIESQMLYGEEPPLAKVKALRGIRAIVADLSDTQTLKNKLLFHFVTLANFLVSQCQTKEQGTREKLKTYLVPGEAIDIFAILLQRLDLVHNMKSYLFPK